MAMHIHALGSVHPVTGMFTAHRLGDLSATDAAQNIMCTVSPNANGSTDTAATPDAPHPAAITAAAPAAAATAAQAAGCSLCILYKWAWSVAGHLQAECNKFMFRHEDT